MDVSPTRACNSRLAALHNLAYINDANKIKIAALGGIEALLKAMGTHTDSVGLLQACRALLDLAYINDANKIKIAVVTASRTKIQVLSNS